MTTWHTIYITDCTGKKFFNTQTSPMSTASEIKNISRHLDGIKAGSKAYDKVGIDKASAVLMLDDSPYQTIDDICDDDLFNELFGK